MSSMYQMTSWRTTRVFVAASSRIRLDVTAVSGSESTARVCASLRRTSAT